MLAEHKRTLTELSVAVQKTHAPQSMKLVPLSVADAQLYVLLSHLLNVSTAYEGAVDYIEGMLCVVLRTIIVIFIINFIIFSPQRDCFLYFPRSLELER